MSRKPRYTFEATFPGFLIPRVFCSIACRPIVENAGTNYQELTTTLYSSDFNLGDLKLSDCEPPDDVTGTAVLTCLLPATPKCPNCRMPITNLGISSGPLESLEQWTLEKIWPYKISLGELDYSSDEHNAVEVTWRYKMANYCYLGNSNKECRSKN